MEFFTTDQHGVTIVDPNEQDRRQLIESILMEDQADFPEVYLSSSHGIVLGYRSDGCLLWEEQGEVSKYLPGTDANTAMAAWNLLMQNDLAGLGSFDWVALGDKD